MWNYIIVVISQGKYIDVGDHVHVILLMIFCLVHVCWFKVTHTHTHTGHPTPNDQSPSLPLSSSSSRVSGVGSPTTEEGSTSSSSLSLLSQDQRYASREALIEVRNSATVCTWDPLNNGHFLTRV